jgi:group II intron reverse transcriptase/maturase
MNESMNSRIAGLNLPQKREDNRTLVVAGRANAYPTGKRRGVAQADEKSPYADSIGDELLITKKRSDSKASLSEAAPKRHRLNLPQANVASMQMVRLLVNSKKMPNGRFKDLISIIANESLLRTCYQWIRGKPGNMTPGIDRETLDGAAHLGFFSRTAADLSSGKFSFSPARRKYIEKPGKREKRPLGITSPRQKIVQKALQLVIEAIFEPEFYDCSHGFRPGKSCHSALKQLQLGNNSTFHWVIEGDIEKCFDSIPHPTIRKLLRRKIACERTLDLVNKALKAGFVDPDTGQLQVPNVGTPQGSVLSPLLSNIVLHELDRYVETALKPEYTKGKARQRCPDYNRLQRKGALRTKAESSAVRHMSSKLMLDPNFKRMKYIRYADDWIILLSASRTEAMSIRSRIQRKLQSLGLTLNLNKTKISHLRKDKCSFLGSMFFIRSITNSNIKPTRNVQKGSLRVKQRFTPRLILHAPIKVLLDKLIGNGFARRNDEGELLAKAKRNLVPADHAHILAFYNQKVRGILNYYTFVSNRYSLSSIVRYLHESCALVLALKYKIRGRTKRSAFSRFGRDLADPVSGTKLYIPPRCALRRQAETRSFRVGSDLPLPDDILKLGYGSSLTRSGIFRKCALCGASKVEMHHIRSVKGVRAKIKTGTASYAQYSGAFKRKQIPLCAYHHSQYHKGELTAADLHVIAGYTGASTC